MGLRAMFSSISGLQSDSDWLDVIGNNISNVNTVGYKASRVEFVDSFSQALSGGIAGSPGRGTGGIDPLEVGLGTRIGSIETLFGQGPDINTGVSTDIAIQGSGFLIAKTGSQSYLTRAGDLALDSDGFLVDPNGGRVQGINASIQYSHMVINSAAAGFAQVTNADLNLESNTLSDLQNIQIDPRMTLLPKATTEVTFRGNLDSLQQPNMLNLFPPAGPSLPVGLMLAQIPPPNGIDTTRMTIVPLPGGGFALQQQNNLVKTIGGIPVPLDNGIITLDDVRAFDTGNYAWEQNPPLQPADQVAETVYDSLGNPRQITVQFYQVNDLGTDGINNPNGPNQVCYAWYAFDTSGSQQVSTANLLGGTGIVEGDVGNFPFDTGYDRGIPNGGFAGDFLWFNTDGSLASSGGIGGPPSPPGVPNFMSIPRVYLPPYNTAPPASPIPTQGAEITVVNLNFGTFGVLGTGKRDGLYSDAEGSYQVTNGVNSYVPKNTAYAASQDGYGDGTLQSLSINPTGVIQGNFSNGQVVGLAQIALAQVQNPGGLNNAGSNAYTLSPNAGPEQVGEAGTGNFGTIQSGYLEGSNVDLSVELSNMIIAQRGFDSNSRMIAVTNENLQVLTQLGLGGS